LKFWLFAEVGKAREICYSVRASEIEMPAKRKPSIVGQVFNRLTVTSEASAVGKTNRVNWICSCGKAGASPETLIRSGKKKSCGCIQRDFVRSGANARTHGMSYTPTYNSWRNIISRCTIETHSNYKNYGGRGITVCERWLTFANFLADMGERPPGTSIDRYPNNDGNYEPGNCRWATSQQQLSNNRRSRFVLVNGSSVTLAEAGRLLGVAYQCFYQRSSDHGVTLQEAVDFYAAKEAA
jgi:hypothetical protein